MMVHIATAAVAVSIAVAVISLSVIFGFKEQISSLVTAITSDVTIANPRSQRQPELYPINDNDTLRSIISSAENVSHIERYALRSGIIRAKEGAAAIALRGIDKEADIRLFGERLESGATPRLEGERRKEILLSQSLASQIGATTDSRVEIIIMEEDTPRRELFKVCGVYRSALGEEGGALALTDIRNIQKMNGWSPSQITGYACRLDDSSIDMLSADILNLRLLREYEGVEDISAVSASEQHSDIFGWLDTHDINATVVLSIMLIVAIFNVVTALLILVLERTRMVGILKSLGMQNKTLRQIFTYHAARIIVRGALIGNIVALVLLLIQRHFHIAKLDESGYFLSEIPVSIGVGWIVAINTLFIAIILAITHLATSIVGRIKVADAIKYS